MTVRQGKGPFLPASSQGPSLDMADGFSQTTEPVQVTLNLRLSQLTGCARQGTHVGVSPPTTVEPLADGRTGFRNGVKFWTQEGSPFPACPGAAGGQSITSELGGLRLWLDERGLELPLLCRYKGASQLGARKPTGDAASPDG